ncbi:MAG: NfeD family protein [Planctomycetota bacterium]
MPLAAFNAVDPLVIAIVLYVLGCALLVSEVFFPSGGVLGFCCACAMVAAIYFAFQSGGISLAATFTAFEVIAAPFLLYFAFKLLPHTPIGRKLVGGAPESKDVDPVYGLDPLIGKIGIARSKMLPSGAVEIEGEMIDAVSQGQAIEPGQYVKVAEVHGNRVIVRLAPEGQRPTSSDPTELLTRPADELGIDELGIDGLGLDETDPDKRPPA